jgi:hypothetical protein
MRWVDYALPPGMVTNLSIFLRAAAKHILFSRLRDSSGLIKNSPDQPVPDNFDRSGKTLWCVFVPGRYADTAGRWNSYPRKISHLFRRLDFRRWAGDSRIPARFYVYEFEGVMYHAPTRKPPVVHIDSTSGCRLSTFNTLGTRASCRHHHGTKPDHSHRTDCPPDRFRIARALPGGRVAYRPVGASRDTF